MVSHSYHIYLLCLVLYSIYHNKDISQRQGCPFVILDLEKTRQEKANALVILQEHPLWPALASPIHSRQVVLLIAPSLAQ